MNSAGTILTVPNLHVRPQSVVAGDDGEWALALTNDDVRLLVCPAAGHEDVLRSYEGESGEHDGHRLLIGPTSARNAAGLRAHLSWLAPQPLGLCTSFGFGDRLGLATPGHVRALKAAGGPIIPVFAQQSARELTRTGRTAQDVLDAATWGAFAEGWKGRQGADADHLKTTADIDDYLAAGFTMFTIDPGEHVGQIEPDATSSDLRLGFDALPWSLIEETPAALLARYAGRVFDIEGHPIRLGEETLVRAAIKYARAVVHVAVMYRHLLAVAGARSVELEVSVDETDSPTSPAEHVFVASELRRLGVTWTSLAPRLVGRFEKGVDYIGDAAAFEVDWKIHSAIARVLGPYKLSLHSGSDKFSIYAAVATHTRGIVHVKTAGTSWLEALRTLAATDPPLFRELYRFARGRYDDDRASYHVSARLDAMPDPDKGTLSDEQLPALLDHFHARQVLHVTFGSILTATAPAGTGRFSDRIMAGLRAHSEAYAGNLERHFLRHLAPFAASHDRRLLPER
ncbi:MAG: tagaturonate epimerase family protein [Acidobacteria bacterium]|nr:tagaturonate epimerase family protein [Acidobacteriota bacterium]